MRPELHVTTRVLPGNRIEVPTPDIPEGQSVDVTIRVQPEPARPRPGLLDFLNSLPPSKRTAQEWEEFDREFQRERDSWDR